MPRFSYRKSVVAVMHFIDRISANMTLLKSTPSYIDGFSGYHQIKIAKEYLQKTTFVTEWGCCQYTMMPFGMKNAAAIFSRIIVGAFKDFIQMLLEVYMDDRMVYGLIRDHLANLHRELPNVLIV